VDAEKSAGLVDGGEMLRFAFALNVVILVPVCAGFLIKARHMEPVFGADSTSRQILLCMYLALTGLSAYLFFDNKRALLLAPAVLGFQVVYKVLSLVLIKDKAVPVYWFNLGVAIFHSIVLYKVYRSCVGFPRL
jgi:hypothetical protein